MTVATIDPIDAALEVLQPHFASTDHALIAAKCAGLLRGYAARWVNSPYRIDKVESVVSSDLYNPATNAKSRSFTASGKIDLHVTEIATNRKAIFDHKTTSSDITDPNGPYWRQLAIEGQATHYMLLEWLNGNAVDFAVWDVVRKPGISPKAVSKADQLSVASTCRYQRAHMTPGDIDQMMTTGRETLSMYAARLAYDCIQERPEWYFQRRTVARLDAEVLEYAGELWGHSQDLLLERRNERHPRNSGACMLYGSPCKFLGVCSGYDTIESDHWLTKPWVHNELPQTDSDGREILTNSRIRTFQTCRRKHHYQYELGVERIDEEEREALWFGTLYHQALEQYFLALQQQQERGN